MDEEEVVDNLDLDTDFSPVEPSTNQNIFVDEDENRPSMGSEEWSDWVLSQLRKDEKYEDKPTCDGLRRVATKLFGPMNVLPPKVHVVNETYAAVTCIIEWPLRTICCSAEVHNNNTDAPFNQYPLATAETRAIGRALRLALNLRRVVTAEEVSRKANISIPVTDENRTEGNITPVQIKFIDLICKRYDISVEYAVLNSVGPHDKITELTYLEAEKVQELLDQWSREKPENVPSYNPDWKSINLAHRLENNQTN